MTVIATTTATTRHLVRLVHAATGRPIADVRVSPRAWPTGWWARVVDGTVVVGSTSSVAGPAELDVIVTDGRLASLLTFPTPVVGQPLNSVRVPLTADDIEVPLTPVDMTLTVEIKDTTGYSDNLTVTVRGASGNPTVPLTEGPDGFYSATRTWGADLINADLRIGTTTVRKVSMDYGHTQTRIFVVDPT